MIQDNEIAIAHIEAGQMFTGILGIEYVFVDDERGAASLWRRANSDLSQSAILAEYVVHLLGGDLVRQIAYKQDTIDVGRQAHIVLLLHGHSEFDEK